MLRKPKLVNFWELLEPNDQSLDDTYMQDSFMGPCKITLVCSIKYSIKNESAPLFHLTYIFFRNVFDYLLHLQVIRFNAPDHAHLLVFWVLKCSLNLSFFFFFLFLVVGRGQGQIFNCKLKMYQSIGNCLHCYRHETIVDLVHFLPVISCTCLLKSWQFYFGLQITWTLIMWRRHTIINKIIEKIN